MTVDLLSLLHNQIDITCVPFSDRGSRLLIFKHPDENSLYLKLAERLIHLEPGLEAYQHRPPFIPNLWFVDGNGNVLDFELSSAAEMLEFQTAIGSFCLVFQDGETLSIGLPAGTGAGIRFRVQTELRRQTGSGGVLLHIRNLAYETNGEVLKNQTTTDQDGCQVEFIVQAGQDSAISLWISDQLPALRPTYPFSETRQNAANRWQAWFSRAPLVAEPYRSKYAYAWWVMANNLISPKGFVGYEAMMPAKTFYLGIWLWDSALHALAYRHVDAELARNQLRVMLAYQLPDGMLPDAIFDEAVVSEIDHPIHARVTKPPILAWAALKLHETNPDVAFLNEIYPALVRWNAWWFNFNDDDHDGLVQYTHPYSSGLDNSPLWDYGMPVESPDINTYLNIQMKSLASIARLLDKPEEAAVWQSRATELTQKMVADLWDEQAGLFRALHNEKPVPVITPFNLYPLWTGELSQAMQERLVAHIKNPAEFGGDYMLPTVAKNDPAYQPEKMWRGPIWANINYFFVEALQKAGEVELARELRQKTLKLLMEQPSLCEYYNPETGKPPATAANMFGWTAAVFIELALQASAEAGSTDG